MDSSEDYLKIYSIFGNAELSKSACCFDDNVKEFERNKNGNRFLNMPRVNRYHIFDFFSHNGDFKLIKRKITVHHKKISKIIKNCLNDYLETGDNYVHVKYGLPAPITNCSRIVGVYRSIRNIKRNVKPREERIDSKFHKILSIFDNDFLSRTISSRIKVYSGDFRYACQNLVDMCTPSKSKINYVDILDGYFSRIDIDLELPRLVSYNPNRIYGLPTNKDSNPGLISKQIVGKKRKDTTRISKHNAINYCKYIMDFRGEGVNTFIVDKSLYEIGGREKRIKTSFKDNMKRVKTRMIAMQEDVPTMIGQSLCKEIMVSLQVLNSGFNYGGRLNGRGNFVKLSKLMSPRNTYDVNFNCDFSGHDNHVDEDKIVAGMAILRLCYPEDEGIDRLFYYIMSSIVFKRLVIPGSNFIYEISKGIPSGHGMTSILTTMCSYGTLSYSVNKAINLYNHKNPNDNLQVSDTYLTMAGDDVVGRIDARLIPYVDKIIKEDTGMIMDNISEHTGFFESNNRNTRTTFLKKKYNSNKFSWNNDELYINLLYPTMFGTKFGGFHDTLYQNIIQAPYDDDINCIILCLSIYHKLSDLFGNLSVIDSNHIGYIKGLRVFGPTSISRVREPPKLLDDFVDFMYSVKNVSSINRYSKIRNYGSFNVKTSNNYFGVDVHSINNVGNHIRFICDTVSEHIVYRRRMQRFFQPISKYIKSHRLTVFDMNKGTFIPDCRIKIPYETYVKTFARVHVYSG